MTKTRTSSAAAALALTAATTVAVAPAHAAPAPHTAQVAQTDQTATVQYVAQDSGSLSGGSLDNEFVQAGLLIVAGLGVSAILAAGAGVAGGAIELPEIPGLPL